MNWKLIKEDTEKKTRLYLNESTGSQCETKVIHVDADGNEWYGFVDLFKIPHYRIAYSKMITDFFATNVTPEDLDKWDEQELRILKSNDADKYEQLIGVIYERKKTRQAIVDPMKQHLALCAIYVLYPDERIDYFDMQDVERKLSIWKMFPETSSFFLNWHTAHISNYLESLGNISKIVLNQRS